MAAPAKDRDFQKRMGRIESLIHEAELYQDPKASANTREIVQAMMELHGAGLERMLEKISEAGDRGQEMIDSLSRDDLVASLLLLYDLHPLDLDTRVRQGIERARPFLRSHGGDVELLGVADGVVRLRLLGSCDSCPSSSVTLKTAVEEAIYQKAPDVIAIEVEKVAGAVQTNGDGRARMALPLVHG
jgi:Fe-S cluster biogenesis protein NfuA